MKKTLIILSLIFSGFMQAQYSYLALGDSYTIGELVELKNSWPHQLVKKLQSDHLKVETPKIIAVTGWRTDELLSAIQKENLQPNSFDVVSLLIGVNNQYQAKPFQQYEMEFKQLLQKAIAISKHDSQGVFVVGIPDYSSTKFAIDAGKPHIKSDIKAYNAYAKQVCEVYNIPFYDILELAHELNKSPNMLAKDQLHPSQLQYTKWVNFFYQDVYNYLKKLPQDE
ncbi:SGNH/GDSL hydrolase family protein [Psychroflexus sp. ALD_RP9]|uniref:SGNH/GDSL hydrolase family protein n=1 Tax=Psychroflexus sp. ALD_RP9 TaxID=2777186 RepID=UPI001A8C9E02|nr:SGNH/GDSL hydrolase family protein [Psychroflexus sp. ALD_RP9]QSS96419.1 SGNH/GDSL hydrolase family protein [Psychroflexus sp. ALD_RP9]